MDNANPGLNNPFTSQRDPLYEATREGARIDGPRAASNRPRRASQSLWFVDERNWLISISSCTSSQLSTCGRPSIAYPLALSAESAVIPLPAMPIRSGLFPPPPPSYRNRRTRQQSKQTISEWAAAFGVRTASIRRKAGSGRGRSEDWVRKLSLGRVAQRWTSRSMSSAPGYHGPRSLHR